MKEIIKKKKNIAGRMLVSSILVGGLALGGFYGANYLRQKDNLIAEQAATIAEQNTTIDDLTSQRSSLLESVAEKNSQIQSLTNLKNSALAQLETRTAERDAEIELKNQALAEKAVALATLETRTQERDAEIELKNQALAEKATAQAEVTRLNGVITSINEELAELESELADELLANSQNQELITSLQADISALNNLKAGLESDLAELEVHIPELENAIDQLEILIDSKNAEIVTLNNQVLDLEGQITTHENTITQKNNEIAGLNGQIADLNTNITTLQSKVSSAENVINFITLPEYTDPIFWEEHQLDITSLNGYLKAYVSDVYYSLLINSVEVPFTGTSLKLTSYLTEGTNSITVRPYVVYNNVNYYGQTFSTSIDYIAPVYLQMSIAEALSAENGTLIEVTGVVTGNYVYYNNRTANTLFIADETGEIALYSSSINNVAFSTAVIGDVITAQGDKTIYSALQQIQNAEIVTAVNEITPIERINVETYAELISKIPQRISLTATVESFKNDAEVILFFDGTTINLRLNDAGDLTTLFEIGKTYQINAHTQGLRTLGEITTLTVVVQSVSDIVEKVRVEVANTQFSSLNLYNSILDLTGEEKIYQDSLLNFSTIDLSNKEISSINGLQLLDYQVGTVINLTNNKISSISPKFQTLISKENISMVNLMFNNIIPGSPGAEVGNKYVLGIQGLIKDAYFYEDSSNIKFYNYNDFYNIFTLDCNISSVNEGENTITDFGSYQISFLNEFNTMTKIFKYGSVNLYFTQSSIDAFEGQNFNISNYIIFQPEEFTEEDFVIKYFSGMQEFTEEDLNTVISSSLGTRNLTIQVYYNNSLITQAFASINTL